MEPPLSNRPRIGILDYGMGNLRSVHRAFLKAGAEAALVQHPREIEDREALVFPGQGAIMDTMRLLRATGWDQCIRDWIAADRSFFGICLGLQALFEFSEEGDTRGLGIFPGSVRRFRFPREQHLKVPHMGWNSVSLHNPGDVLAAGLQPEGDQFYFVHSYFADPDDPGILWSTTDYGGRKFCSAIRQGNLVATQFHPEKSQDKGLRLYRNFIDNLPSVVLRGC